jgi:hypothetical protein
MKYSEAFCACEMRVLEKEQKKHASTLTLRGKAPKVGFPPRIIGSSQTTHEIPTGKSSGAKWPWGVKPENGFAPLIFDNPVG